jgi:hypothetical protein
VNAHLVMGLVGFVAALAWPCALLYFHHAALEKLRADRDEAIKSRDLLQKERDNLTEQNAALVAGLTLAALLQEHEHDAPHQIYLHEDAYGVVDVLRVPEHIELRWAGDEPPSFWGFARQGATSCPVLNVATKGVPA